MTIELCSIVVAIFAACIALYTWFVTHKKNKDDITDAMLTDLIKITLEKPMFRDPEYCRNAVGNPDANLRLEYDAYATLVWNYQEKLFQTYGTRLHKGPFYGALKDLAQRHKTWLFDDDRYKDYDPNLLKFLSVQP